MSTLPASAAPATTASEPPRLQRSDLLFRSNRRVFDEARQLEPQLAGGSAIEGLIHPREGLLLYLLARRAAQLGDVVEIGSYLGRSTWYLARGLMDAGSPHRVISIDPHPDDLHERYLGNLREGGVLDRVDVRMGFSYDVVRDFDRPIGLLWIDGAHEYDAVRRDFEDWFPMLVDGGWIAFHDTVNMWRGPTQLVRELLMHRKDIGEFGVVWLTSYARKVRPRSANRPRALASWARYELLTLAQARHSGFGAQLERPATARERGA